MTMSSDRDAAINAAVSEQTGQYVDQNVDYRDLRERVRRGDLGGLDRDKTWEALSSAVEGFDYDISEGHSSNRGTLDTDAADSKRLNGLLGEFEKKFGLPDHWQWGPVGGDGYDYDGEGASQSDPLPSLSLDGIPTTPRPTGTIRDEVNQYKDAQDRERDDDRDERTRPHGQEIPMAGDARTPPAGYGNQRSGYGSRSGRGRIRY